MSEQHFKPALFRFLRDLAANNDRDWFAANKERYERDVRRPLLGFIADLALPLAKVAPQAVADPRPVGGSMFRIHRDIRFTADKSPYKTHASAQFRYRGGKNVHVPGYYLHLEPGNVLAGAGIWRPDREALARVRARLVADAAGWRRATSNAAFRKRFDFEGEVAKRVPRDVPADHPLIEEIKRKDFVVMARLTQKEVTSADFLATYLGLCRQARPFVDYIAGALEGGPSRA
jgi:uncharacterized protein (TIGR02453 family)